MRVWGDGHVIAGHRGSEALRGLEDVRTRGVIAYRIKPLGLTEVDRLPGFFATGHDHGSDPAPRTVPAP